MPTGELFIGLSADDWIAIGTWVGAGATTAAVIVSLRLARKAATDAAKEQGRADRAEDRESAAESRANAAEKRERDRAAAEAFDRLAAQARLVHHETVWVGGATLDTAEMNDYGRQISVSVSNDSRSSVYDLWATAVEPYSQSPVMRGSAILTGSTGPEGDPHLPADDRAVLWPGKGVDLTGYLVADIAAPTNRPLVNLEFTDANEVRWRRSPGGKLERIPRVTQPTGLQDLP